MRRDDARHSSALRASRTRSGRLALLGACAAMLVSGCGGASSPSSGGSTHGAVASSSTHSLSTRRPPAKLKPPGPPRLLASAGGTGATRGFVPVVAWHGRPVAWIARTPTGLALLSFDQHFLGLHLHSGTQDAGPTGWRFGPSVVGRERDHLIAAFNGAFKLSVGVGGFSEGGRTAAPLRSGLGSVVTYTDGTTDIGAWNRGVPAPGRSVASVRQNLTLLIDHGQAASTVGCLSCWGATLGGVVDPARAALGITADGHLVWAGGEHITVSALANALLAARVVRAVELDINPEWVAAYLYRHGHPRQSMTAVPVMPGQQGIPGEFLAPWSRDFFTIVAR